MARREGHVRRRKDGLFEARYVGTDGRKHSLYAKSNRDAQARLRAALIEAANGMHPTPQRMTVASFLGEWLETSVKPRCKPRTYESYSETVRRYIAPAIGHVRLAKLEPSHVQRMLSDLTARGSLSPTTVRYSYVVLRNALGRALKTGLVTRNVATLADPPARVTTEIRPLTANQVRRLLDGVRGDRLEALYVLAITTGLRQGELLALGWSDVDLDGRTVTVRKTLELRTRRLADPKTERARRTLRLPGAAVSALNEHRLRQVAVRLAAGARWHDRGLVFSTGTGAALDSRNVTRAFQARLAELELPRQRFHDLRHACATMMLEEGVELALVSRVLGHADLGTTADIYGHMTPVMRQRAADQMDAILRRTAG